MRNFSKRFLLVITVLLVGILLVACNGGADKKIKDAMDKVTIESLLQEGQNANKLTKDLKTLPSSEGDVNISWKSSNIEVLSNKGKVVRLNEDAKVTLTAKFSLDKVEKDKDYKFTILAKENTDLDPDLDLNLPKIEDAITIAEFLELDEGGTGIIVGVVTNTGPYNSFSIEDETGAVAFRIGGKNKDSIDFSVGDAVSANVKKNTFNGLIQAEAVESDEYTVHKGDFGRLPVIDLNGYGLKESDLLAIQSRSVDLKNATVTNKKIDQYGTVDLTLKIGDETIELRWDNRVIPFDATFIKGLEEGDKIDVYGATIGWHFEPQLSVQYSNLIVPAGEKPVEPEPVVEYTIKFDTDGGNEIADIKVEEGTTIKSLPTPTKSGFDFKGWFTEEELTNEFDLETEITKDITLYAKWEEKEVNEDSIVIDFEDADLPSAYGDGSFESNDIIFNYGHSRDQENYGIEGIGLMLRRASDSYLEFTLEDGIDELSFEYRKAFTGGSPRQLEVTFSVDGEDDIVITTDEFGEGSGEQDDIHEFIAENLNIDKEVTIKVKNVGETTGNRQTVIDNIIIK